MLLHRDRARGRRPLAGGSAGPCRACWAMARPTPRRAPRRRRWRFGSLPSGSRTAKRCQTSSPACSNWHEPLAGHQSAPRVGGACCGLAGPSNGRADRIAPCSGRVGRISSSPFTTATKLGPRMLARIAKHHGLERRRFVSERSPDHTLSPRILKSRRRRRLEGCGPRTRRLVRGHSARRVRGHMVRDAPLSRRSSP